MMNHGSMCAYNIETICGYEIYEPRVQNAAKFAIEEHNQRVGANLKLVEVQKAATELGCACCTIYYLMLKAVDVDSGNHMIFKTAVFRSATLPDTVPRLHDYIKSVGLEYVSDASSDEESPPLPPRPPPCDVVNPDILQAAVFAVQHHNEKKLTQHKYLMYLSIVKFSKCFDGDYTIYNITVLTQDLGERMMIFTSCVTKHNCNCYMESIGLHYICEVLPLVQTDIVVLPAPSLLDYSTKEIAEFTVRDHNCKVSTQLEFVDVLEVTQDIEGDGIKYSLTLQVIDHGVHRIYKAEVIEGDSGCCEPVGPLRSTPLEYISETQPRPKAKLATLSDLVPDWILSGLLPKATDTFNLAMIEEHQAISDSRFSEKLPIGFVKEGIKEEWIPFLELESRIAKNDGSIDNEELLAIARALKCFAQLVKGSDVAHALLLPLQILCTVEQPWVREIAVEAFKLASE